MSLLITPIAEGQSAIILKLLEVLHTHSSASVESFQNKLKYLSEHGDNNTDVVITRTYFPNYSELIEFGLKWVKKGDETKHPIYQQPFLIGGLIFDPLTNKWSIHT